MPDYYERMLYYFEYLNNQKMPSNHFHFSHIQNGDLILLYEDGSYYDLKNFIKKTDNWRLDEGFKLWLEFKLVEVK